MESIKILVLLTNTSNLKVTNDSKTKTGFDIKELAHAHTCIMKEFPETKFTFVTPNGGRAPIDPLSLEDKEKDQVLKKFLADKEMMEKFEKTFSLNQVKDEKFCAMIVPGGAGALIDLPHAMKNCGKLVDSIYNEKKGLIASIGHGASAFLEIPSTQDSSKYWISGRKLTAITKVEDTELGLISELPFVLEDEMKHRKVKFETKSKFSSNVVVDDRLITAQNPQSTQMWVKEMIKIMKPF